MQFLRTSFEKLAEREQPVLNHISQRLHISQETHRVFDASLIFSQRQADHVASFVGSWKFPYCLIRFYCSGSWSVPMKSHNRGSTKDLWMPGTIIRLI